MVTTQAVLTPQQKAALNELLKKFADRLSPAKLKNTHRNGLLLADYNVSRGLPITVDTMYDAAKVIYRELDWDVKPAKLILEEKQNKPASIESAQESERTFVTQLREGEKVDADAKEHAALVKQCKQVIEGYNPTKHTRNGSTYDARERDDMQAHWNAQLAVAEKHDVVQMRVFTKALVEAIQKRWADRERASERL